MTSLEVEESGEFVHLVYDDNRKLDLLSFGRRIRYSHWWQ